MASASTPSANEPAWAHISPHSAAKTKEKAQISGSMICSRSHISVVAFASVDSEKTLLKKLMIMIIIIRKNIY